MITGVFTAGREAVLPLVLSSADGHEVEVQAVVDTGFDGFLTLPIELIERLGLNLLGRVQAALGDGSELRMGGLRPRFSGMAASGTSWFCNWTVIPSSEPRCFSGTG